MQHLHDIFIFLVAALAVVPLAKRLGLGSVLGYLIAGLLIGPQILGLITDVQSILSFSEFGVVLLLFIIGLELEPRRLWLMRRIVFGTGGMQVIVTTAVFAIVSRFFGLSTLTAVVVGLGLALSSTAFVMATLTETKQLTTAHGRTTFGILLFQDLAVIPTLALLPLLARGSLDLSHTDVSGSLLRIVGVAVFLVLTGRYLIRPVFRFIAMAKSHELFTAASLLIVVGTGLLMESIGLSMSLGAFAAGVLLANSEYRHDMEANIEPFRGLLMGLFFMAVGMATQINLVLKEPLLIAGLLVGFLVIKISVLWLIGILSRIGKKNAVCVAMNLAVGGEFAFVLYGAASQNHLLDQALEKMLVVIVTLSMIVSPLLLLVKNFVFSRRAAASLTPKEFDQIEDNDSQVIIAGFGRFGQIIGRLLRTQKINYTALEFNAQQVDFVRRFGGTLYYGDPSNVELLRSAKADRARILVVAIDEQTASIRTVQTAKKYFPHLTIYARARNRGHAFALLDEGVTNIYRETFLSSLEVGEHVLAGMGIPAERIKTISSRFRRYDEDTILRQHASLIHKDEKKLQEESKNYMAVLEELMQMDETVVGGS